MKRSDELKQSKTVKVAEMRSLLDKAKTEKRTLTEDEQKSLEALKVDIVGLETEISGAEFVEEQERQAADEAEKMTKRQKPEQKSPETKASTQYSLLRAIRTKLQGKELDGIEAEMEQEAQNEFRASKIEATGNLQVPSWILGAQKRDMTAGTTTAGGYTIQTDVGGLIPFLTNRMRVRELGATVLTGLTGNVDFPRNDAIAAAVWEGENDANAETSPTLDRVQLSPNRLGAFTDVSKQLLAQSTIDVDMFVRQQLAQAIALEVDRACINGSGSGAEPTGILGISGTGSVAIGTNGGAITWAKTLEFLSDLETANADQGTIGWLTTPGLKAQLMQIEKASGTAQFIMNDPGQSLLGYRLVTSNQVPSNLTKGSGTNLHAMIFGNWAELLIGQWAGIDLVVDPYSGAKNALVTLVINSWWDIAARHAASFVVGKDFTA